MSDIPVSPDVLPADEPVIDLPGLAERMGVPVTRVHDLLRDRHFLAIRRRGTVVAPTCFFQDSKRGTWAPIKHLPGLIAVLGDGGYDDEAQLTWLWTEDESLPGRPIDALHGHLAREVVRRAQAMAF